MDIEPTADEAAQLWAAFVTENNIQDPRAVLSQLVGTYDDFRNLKRESEWKELIIDAWVTWCQSRNYNPEDFLLDMNVLEDVIYHFFKDVHRIKRYHPRIKTLEEAKNAGFLTYWFTKLKPMTILNDNSGLSHYQSLNINEIFCFFFCVSRVNPGRRNKVRIDDENSLKTLLYSLRYRKLTGDALTEIYKRL